MTERKTSQNQQGPAIQMTRSYVTIASLSSAEKSVDTTMQGLWELLLRPQTPGSCVAPADAKASNPELYRDTVRSTG